MRAAALLFAISVVFLTVFAFQRDRSVFLAVEARAAESRVLAEQNGVAVREVMALHELLGGRLNAQELAEQVEVFAEKKRELGDELLAVLAIRGRAPLAAKLRKAAGRDRARLRKLIRAQRVAVEDAVRFASMTGRFAARGF